MRLTADDMSAYYIVARIYGFGRYLMGRNRWFGNLVTG